MTLNHPANVTTPSVTDTADAPRGKPRTKPPAVTKPVAAAEGRHTKQALLISLLQRPEGATIAELVAATGWQNHSIRGAISFTLKKKLGLNIASLRDEKRGRVYRITKPAKPTKPTKASGSRTKKWS